MLLLPICECLIEHEIDRCADLKGKNEGEWIEVYAEMRKDEERRIVYGDANPADERVAHDTSPQ